MKKLVSIIIVAVMLMSIGSVSVFAEVPPDDIYYERFVEKYGEPIFYSEVYTYFDGPDYYAKWVLVQAATSRIFVDPGQNPVYLGIVNGDFVFNVASLFEPFKKSYAVYDVANDEFIDLTEVDFDNYEGLAEEVRFLGIADIVGDVDYDREVSIMDATEIQRIIAELSVLKNFYVADFNRDKYLDILDATAIQRKLAKLDDPESQMIVKHPGAFIYNTLPEMPEDVETINYETLYTYENFMKYPSTYFENYFDDIYAIVKTKAQYDELLNIYNDRFDEEFFESNFLVVTIRRTSNLKMLASATDLCIKDNTLYFRANEYYPPSEFIQPVESFYTSIVSVDKSVLKDIVDIVRVK